MIPPIPPTPTQTGAPPPLGAPPPMAPPMGAPMPPMPPSPMGKGIGSMLNTDPMARSNFSMMLSDIQNQAMIPPMPMHMNEGGLVGFIQNLLKGIGSIFRGGGGQGSSGGMSFGDAFAKARREGKKVFEYNGKMFTTELKEEQAARLAEEEAKRKPERYTGPTIPAMEDPYDEISAPTSAMIKRDSVADLLREAQQSRRARPVMEDPYDEAQQRARFTGFDPKVPEGGRPRTGSEDISRNFANRLEQIKRQMEADQSKAPDIDARMNLPAFRSIVRGLSGLDSSNTIDANLEEGNIVDAIQNQLEKLTKKVSGNNPLPEIPKSPDLSQIMMGNNPKYFKDDNTSLGEKFQSLLQDFKEGNVSQLFMGLSDKLSKSINDQLNQLTKLASEKEERDSRLDAIQDILEEERSFLGMNQGGNPKVEKLKAMIAESGNPQEKLQELFEYFTGDSTKDEDNSQILEALAIIQQSPEFMNEATRSSLLGTMPPQPKERVSDNVMGRKFGLQRDFLDAIKENQNSPVIQALLSSKGDRLQGLMNFLGAPRYAFTPEVKELLGLSNGGSVTEAIARLEKGGEPKKAREDYLFFDPDTQTGFPRPLDDIIMFPLENPKTFVGAGGAGALGVLDMATGNRASKRLLRALLDDDSTFTGRKTFDGIISTGDEINKKEIYKKLLKSGLGQLLKKGLPLMSLLAPSKTADASLPESMIVNKNQGGAINASNLGMISGQQAPPFLPGQQGDSPFAGINLPSENLVNEPVQVFSNVGRQGQGQGYQTIQDVIKDVGGATGQVERLYFKDPETGIVFDYDYDDKGFEGLGPEYYGKSLGDLQLVSGISKDRNNENVRFQVDDPSKYDVSGILGYDPETTEAMAIEQAKDDKSDNDIFYTAPNGQTYVDTTGTGESIPVGSYNIVRGNEALSQYYSVDEEGERIGNIVGSGPNFVQPALTKTETGYVATDSDKDPFEKNEDGVVSQESIQNNLTGGSFNIGGLEFTSPASNQINLEPFFNAVESSGGLNQFLYSQQDRLPKLKQLLGIGDGTLPEGFGLSDIQYNEDGSLDLTNLTNKFNEYLTGQDNEGNTSDLYGNTFQQTTDSNMIGSSGTGDISNTGNGSGGDSSVDDSVDDDSTGDGDDSDDNGGDETTPKTLFNFKDLYTNTEPMEDIIARTVVDSPVSSEGMGTFSPINSSVVNNPDMFTDFSFPDPSDMTIRDNENPFEDDNRGNVDPIILPIKVPDQQTNTANMNMGGMPNNGDVISKFLAMDIDKRPLSKTPKVADMSTLTASIKMNEGGEVTAGMNKAIDTFLASMM